MIVMIVHVNRGALVNLALVLVIRQDDQVNVAKLKKKTKSAPHNTGAFISMTQ